MTSDADEIIGEYQYGFRSRSTVNHISSILKILEKKWEYNNEVYQLFKDFEKASDTMKRESLYYTSILIKCGIQKN